MAGRILFVDDEADLRFMVTSYFEMCGYDVIGASTADEAWSLAQEVPPTAVVLDVNLPGAGSASLLESLKRLYPKTPVILYTGRQADDAVVRTMLAQGAQRYLLKDGSLEGLLAAVKEICG